MEIPPITENQVSETNNVSSINKALRPLLIAAYISLSLGFIIGIYLLFDYNTGYTDIRFKMELSDLGTILSGSVGSLWALAGVFFFIYNLQQQKETLALQREELALQREELKNQVCEMKTANATAIIQQKAITEQTLLNLYYTLLNNNKKIIEFSNLEELEKTKEDLINYSIKYKNAIRIKHFKSRESTGYFPPFFLLRKGEKIVNNLKNIIENVIDVITFIEDNMDKKNFYHRMFFNQLSHTEKFLIGFVFSFNLFDTKKIKSSFDYTKLYKENKAYYSLQEGYFPALSINIVDIKSGVNFTDTKIDYNGKANNLIFRFKIFENIFTNKIIFKKIKLTLGNRAGNDLTFQNEYDKEISDGLGIDSIEIFKNFRANNTDTYNSNSLLLIFTFLYDNTLYDVSVQLTIKFNFPATVLA